MRWFYSRELRLCLVYKVAVFSTLDAIICYLRVEIDKMNSDKTAFTSYYRVYRFICMLLNFRTFSAPCAFWRTMKVIIATTEWRFVFVYLDYILVYSNSRKERIGHDRRVFAFLNNAGITTRLIKSKCFTETIVHLSLVTCPRRWDAVSNSRDKIREQQPLINLTKLGLSSYLSDVLQRFVPNLACIVAPST